MNASALVFAAALVASSVGQAIKQAEIDQQNEAFQRLWGDQLVWKFEDLPEKGSVPDWRMPYSGYIYPDTAGGTVNALQKYDQAFNRGRYSATQHERWDTTAYRTTVYETRRTGLFGWGRRRVAVTRTPHWHGHCNGWTAAASRHAEPEKAVVRNGVTFWPRDIKALLAEIYIYSHTETLAGDYNYVVNPGTLHVILGNWLGRYEHPIGMEATPGKEKWNYPIYAYANSSAKRGSREVEVRSNVAYAYSTRGEPDKAPRITRQKYFHYSLDLNEDGEIVGGQYYRDSSQIDLLWVALTPVQGGQEGNERGNPYVDVEQVLSLWRDSVSPEIVDKWVNVQWRPEDAVEPQLDEEQLAVADDESNASEEPIEDASSEATSPREGDRPQGDQPQADQPQGDQPQADQPQGDQPQGDQPQGDQPQGDQPQGDQPQGDQPQGDQPQVDQP
jgi:hypothetical protein